MHSLYDLMFLDRRNHRAGAEQKIPSHALNDSMAGVAFINSAAGYELLDETERLHQETNTDPAGLSQFHPKRKPR